MYDQVNGVWNLSSDQVTSAWTSIVAVHFMQLDFYNCFVIIMTEYDLTVLEKSSGTIVVTVLV